MTTVVNGNHHIYICTIEWSEWETEFEYEAEREKSKRKSSTEEPGKTGKYIFFLFHSHVFVVLHIFFTATCIIYSIVS